eukprot:12934329-Prorocentrum_lima.AAC.1
MEHRSTRGGIRIPTQGTLKIWFANLTTGDPAPVTAVPAPVAAIPAPVVAVPALVAAVLEPMAALCS